MNRGSPKARYAILLLATILGSGLTFLPVPASAAGLGCGATITTNTTLRANIGPCSGDGLVIGASNVTLDCAGFMISGTSTPNFGIHITGQSGVIVENCNVSGFWWGIYLYGSSHNVFTGNTAYNDLSHLRDGFTLSGSSDYNTFNNNTATMEYDGFNISGSSNYNTFTHNKSTNNTEGFYLYSAFNNTFAGNTAESNDMCFYLIGASDNSFSGDTAHNSWHNGFLVDYSSDSNTFTNNTATGAGGYGFVFASTPLYYGGNPLPSDGSILTNNTAYNDGYGFGFLATINNTVTNNTADNNGVFGFYLLSSNSSIFTRNTVNGNGWTGFYLYSSSDNNTLTGNTADSNGWNCAPACEPGEYGFYLADASDNNILTGNTASGNSNGIAVVGSNDTLAGNVLTGNTVSELTINGFTFVDWSQFRVVSQTLDGQPPGTDSVNMTSTSFYDVHVENITGGIAELCMTAANQTSVMQYWSGTNWVNATGQTVDGTAPPFTVCGDIPVSELSGTPIAIGTPNSAMMVTHTTLTCKPSSVAVGSTTTCRATVKGSSTPTGKISWSSSGQGKFSSTSCKLSNGACSVKYTPTSSSSLVTITASYVGDKHDATSSGTFSLTVTKRLTSIGITPKPASVNHGKSIILTVTVTDTSPGSHTSPMGTVTWTASKAGGKFSTVMCTLVAISSTQSRCTVTYTAPSTTETMTVTAKYNGDSTHNISSGTSKLTVT